MDTFVQDAHVEITNLCNDYYENEKTR